MKTSKTELLELFVQQIGLSEEELQSWFNNRSEKLTDSAAPEPEIIPTPLALVYKKDNDLSILPGLDLARKDELWGIRLQNGVLIALECGSIPETDWDTVKKHVLALRLNGSTGKMPDYYTILRTWGDNEERLLQKTIKILEKNQINADGYWGSIWCEKEPDESSAYFIYLGTGDVVPTYKNMTKKNDRVAVEF